MKEISFLIPAYNQSEKLKKCIQSITKYEGNDIEIIVNDDCSEENLKQVIDLCNDNRIKLFRNKNNLGLDLNILNGVKNCEGKFIFLLRTSDYVIAESIPYIIEIIKKNPKVVYITGTCLDDDGLPRMMLEEKCFCGGLDAINKIWQLHFHPSGSLFRRDQVDLKLYFRYYNMFSNDHRLYFMVEQLMRLKLAEAGDVYTIGRPIWIWTYTNRNTIKSVHNNGRVYDLDIIYARYENEQFFINSEIDINFQTVCRLESFEFWLRAATWDYVNIMKDAVLMNHYGIKSRKIDVENERNRYLEYVKNTDIRLGIVDAEYLLNKHAIIQKNIDFEKQYNKNIFSHQLAVSSAEKTLRLLENVKKRGGIKNVIKVNGYSSITLYGMGYLGTIVWNEMIKEDIKPQYICDKKYKKSLEIENGLWAIPPEKLEMVKTDIVIITPMHIVLDIMSQFKLKCKIVSIEEFLMNC